MRTVLTVKDPKNFTPQEYREAVRLTMRERGIMASTIRKIYRGIYPYKTSFARIVQIRDVQTKLLLAQALIDNYIYHGKISTPFAQFYVRAEYRRQGLGKRLMKKCDKIAIEQGWNDFDVQPWNSRSEAFFAYFNDKPIGKIA